MRNDLADSRNIIKFAYPKEDDGELYTACPIIKGSRGIEPLNPLPQRRIRLTLPAYLCLKTALRRSEIREYYILSWHCQKEIPTGLFPLRHKHLHQTVV